MDQRVGDHHHPALVQDRGHPEGAMGGVGIEDVVDLLHHMGRFPGRPGHHRVAMAMGQHQRREHVAVPRRQPVHVRGVEALPLQALVEERLVGLEMLGVGGVDHLQLAHRIGHAGGFQLGLHVRFAAHHDRLAEAVALIGHRGAQRADVVTLGEDHRRLGLPGARVQPLQHRGGRVHPRLQAQLVAFHVDDRPPRHPGRHADLRHRRRDPPDQPRIERGRDDVVAAEFQLPAIGDLDLVGHVLARQLGQRPGAGDLHLVVDRARVDVQRAAEQVGKAQHVVDLVRIVRPAGGDDGVQPHVMGFLGGDLGVRVGHGEDHRVVGHRGDHLAGQRALDRDAQEDIGADHRLLQGPEVGLGGMGRLPLVHAIGAALIDHALGVADDALRRVGAHRLDQFQTGDPRRTGAVQHNAAILDLLPRQQQRVHQPGGADHGGAVLVVVEDGDVHLFLQALLDDEAFRRLDVLKVDAAEAGLHQLHRAAEFVGVLGVDLDVDRVHVGEALEQHRLAFHHRLRRQGAQIAQPQHRGAVRDHRDGVALGGVVIGALRVLGDRLAGHGDPGGIGQAQVALGRHRHRRLNLELPRCRQQVEGQRLFPRDLVACHSCLPAARVAALIREAVRRLNAR